MLFFGGGTRDECKFFADIIQLFCDTSGIKVSLTNSCFYSLNIEDDIREMITSCLPYKFNILGEHLKYMGFFLKLGGYKIKDWLWLVELFEIKINHWTFKILSIGCILTLFIAVLIGIRVYWLSHAQVLRTVLKMLISIMFNFLYSGKATRTNLQMVKWDKLLTPKSFRSWDIKKLFWFRKDVFNFPTKCDLFLEFTFPEMCELLLSFTF